MNISKTRYWGITAVSIFSNVIPSFGQNKTDSAIIKDNPPPNILLVITDDLGIDALSIYNRANAITANTPNLMRLSENGITFDDVWASALSSPTRANIITGRYGFRTNVMDVHSDLPENEVSIQSYLSLKTDNQYANSIIGKWHLSKDIDSPSKFGVQHFAGYMGGRVRNYNNWTLTTNGVNTQEKEYITTKLTDLSIEWINKQTKPWFCWLAYPAPHTPLHLPPSYMHSQGKLSNDNKSIRENPLPYFLAMAESVDYELGRLLDALGEEKLKNTIVIFVGDNGTDRNLIQTPYLKGQGKGTVYEGGVRVPMIVWGRGVTRVGERDNNLVHATDLFATILELAGVDQKSYQDSYSFKPLLNKAAKGLRNYNYTEIKNRRSIYTNAIKDKQYKLISTQEGKEMLFDLLNDPYERQDLLEKKLNTEQKASLKRLQKELKKKYETEHAINNYTRR